MYSARRRLRRASLDKSNASRKTPRMTGYPHATPQVAALATASLDEELLLHMMQQHHSVSVLYVAMVILYQWLNWYAVAFFIKIYINIVKIIPIIWGNALLIPRCICSLLPKTNCKFSKSLGKNIHMYISTFYVLIQSFIEKQTFFVACAKKKDKNSLTKRLILAPKFVFFT
jgi:hypothetical protein